MKKIVSILLVAIIAISSVTGVAAASTAPVKTSAGGGLTSVIVDGLVTILKPAVVYGLEQAGEATTSDSLGKAIDQTIKLINGSEKTMQKEILNEINHVSEQDDAMYTFTAESFDLIDDRIKDLSETTKLTSLPQQRDNIRQYDLTYGRMLQTFNNYLECFIAYNEDPTSENLNNLKYSHNKVEKILNNENVINSFETDLDNFLASISPYKPYYDSTNYVKWGTKGSSDTYLDYLFDYSTEVTNFENNVFEDMSSGINEVGSVSYLYLQSYKFYIEAKAKSLNNSDLAPVEAKEIIDEMWYNFDIANRKLTRGLNQMYSLYEDEMSTYMRTYDTLAKVGINNYKSTDKITSAYNKTKYPDVQFRLYTVYDTDKWKDTTFKSDVIENAQWFYQFKLVDEKDNKTYAIRNSNSTTKNGDKTNKRFAYQDAVEKEIMLHKESCFSLDFINLTKGLSNGLSMISSQSQLHSITKSNAYVSSNNLIKNITRELSHTHGNNVAIPDTANKASSTNESNLDDGLFMLLDSKIEWDCSAGMFDYDDADMKWLNISMPLNDNHEVELDCEDDIIDNFSSLKDKEAYAMFTGSPKTTAKLSTSGSGDAFLSVNGNKVATKNTTSGKLTSGEVMSVKVKPDNGNTVDSIILKDAYGNILDTLLASEFDKNGNITIDSQEMTDSLTKDENGYIGFTLPVPCQNVTFEVKFKQEDPALKKFSVSLQSDENTVMQFTSYDFVTTNFFSKGDTVTFSVMPEEGKVCTGVVVMNELGEKIDVLTKDITVMTTKLKDNEKIFQLTMPEHGIIVEPIIRDNDSVNLSTGGNADVKLTTVDSIDNIDDDSSLWDNSNYFDPKAGDTVVFEATAKDGFFVSKVDVRTRTGEIIDATTIDNKICFVMPEEYIDITVETKVDSDDYVSVTLNNWNDGISDVEFVDENLTKLNTSTTRVTSGDKIMFITKGDTPRSFAATDSISKHIYCAFTEISDDSLAENEHLYTVNVPDIENLMIYVH